MQEDTYKGQANDPLSLNLYTYVSNNPLKYIDPTGHWQETDASLDKNSRIEISRLTDLYFATNDKAEKLKIANKVNLVRKNAEKATDVSVTGEKYSNTASVKKTGTISAKDWQSISTTMNSSSDRSYKTSTISNLKLNSVNPITAGLGPINRENTTTTEENEFNSNIMLSKTRSTQPDSGLRDLSDEEVARRARDRSLSGEERRRYQTEEKLSGLRNKQKRQNNNITPVDSVPILVPAAMPKVVPAPEPTVNFYPIFIIKDVWYFINNMNSNDMI